MRRESEAKSFAESALERRWRAEHLLSLTLTPIQSFGTWPGVDPLDGLRQEVGEGPVLVVTHNRGARGLLPFLRAEPPVIERLEPASGCLWADGFVDRIRTLDMGTLSSRAQGDGGRFAEPWFARFQVTEAGGSLPEFRPATGGRVLPWPTSRTPRSRTWTRSRESSRASSSTAPPQAWASAPSASR